MNHKMNLTFFCSLTVLFGVFFSINLVFAIQVKSLSGKNSNDLYQVTCENDKQHTIIANSVEQDFQYYYPDKGYYIKYYSLELKDVYDFAEWVCRNK